MAMAASARADVIAGPPRTLATTDPLRTSKQETAMTTTAQDLVTGFKTEHVMENQALCAWCA